MSCCIDYCQWGKSGVLFSPPVAGLSQQGVSLFFPSTPRDVALQVGKTLGYHVTRGGDDNYGRKIHLLFMFVCHPESTEPICWIRFETNAGNMQSAKVLVTSLFNQSNVNYFVRVRFLHFRFGSSSSEELLIPLLGLVVLRGDK